jgi:hypothetical protein
MRLHGVVLIQTQEQLKKTTSNEMIDTSGQIYIDVYVLSVVY